MFLCLRGTTTPSSTRDVLRVRAAYLLPKAQIRPLPLAAWSMVMHVIAWLGLGLGLRDWAR